MKRAIGPMAFLPFILLVGGLFFGCKKHTQEPVPAIVTYPKIIDSFSFSTDKNPVLKQNIYGEIKGDTIYITTFSGTDLSSLIPEFTFKGSKITVNGQAETSGTSIHNFTNLIQYQVTAQDNSTKIYTIKCTDTGLPALYISTQGISINSKDDYITGSVKIIENLAGKVSYNGTMKIKGRGNSTWLLPKKPYHLKLDTKSAILDMPANKDWVLLANYADKSLMRNALAFELSTRLGMAYTSKSKFVEVILNGEYVGNYQLTEEIKQDKNRVNVEEQTSSTVALPDITGGYIVEVDGYQDEPVHFYTSKGVNITVHYPEDDDINDAQKKYITNHLNNFEGALFSTAFTDPINGYRKYLDVDSYINGYLINEVMGNPDMYWSMYMYKKRNDDKLYIGPVWDYDIAANNDSNVGDVTYGLMLNSALPYFSKQWLDRLMQDPAFRQCIRTRWNEVKDKYIQTFPLVVDQFAQMLDASQKKNFARWNILSTKVHLEYYIAGSYNNETVYLKSYFVNRIKSLDVTFNSTTYQ